MTIGFMFPLAVLVVPFNQKTRDLVLHNAWRIYSYILVYLGFFARIYKEDRRSEKSYRPAGLVICNHMSMGDIPLLHTTMAGYPLMKKEILSYPFIGFITKMSGAIAVDRRDSASRKKSFLRIVEFMKQGHAVLYYPEGTRSRELKPKPVEKIHKPVLAMAYQSQTTVYPASLYGTHLLYTKKGFRPFLKLGLIMHKEVLPKDFSTQEEFINYCWNKVHEGFSELQEVLKVEKN